MDVDVDNIDQNGTNVIQWRYWANGNQQWVAVQNDDRVDSRPASSRPQADDVTYRLVNVQSRKVLAVDSASTDDGANIVQWEWYGGDEQRWRVIEADDDTYRIENVNSGHVVAMNDASTENSSDVVQTEWTSGDHQKWKFNPP